ncbi:glycosyltransferase family 4 protein [Actinomadura fibrosa]|uniref:Glycosyltransferase family 4 protein n=1 Tax=Actinomadura fibrosa TaxID=111802 RepID=A0ABW2XJD7_9ACTN
MIVARATAALYSPDDTQRVAWERTGLQRTIAAGGRVAAISAYMRAHLADAYHLPDTGLLDLPNGLTGDDWRRIAPPDTRLLPPKARTGFVLAMGRAVPYKGFDDLLDAMAILKSRDVAVPHTLLAAVTDTRDLTDYQQHLAQRIAEQNLNVTLLPRFDPGLRSLLVHPALAAVVVPSRAEPFGRIPLEAFVAGAAPVIATTAGGLADLVTTGAGFTVPAADPRALAAALQHALTITTADRVRLRATGRRVAARYNYEQTVREFLHRRAPWTISPAPKPPGRLTLGTNALREGQDRADEPTGPAPDRPRFAQST